MVDALFALIVGTLFFVLPSSTALLVFGLGMLLSLLFSLGA